MKNSLYVLGIKYYKKSMEINPDNTNAIEMLKEIYKFKIDLAK